MTNNAASNEIAYARLDRNALSLAESYMILRQSRQLHLLPLKGTRLLLGRLFRIRLLHTVVAPTKLLLAPVGEHEKEGILVRYPILASMSEQISVVGFQHQCLVQHADPRSDTPQVMVLSIDSSGHVGVTATVMDLGTQVASWLDVISIGCDSTFYCTSNHSDSGKLRPHPGMRCCRVAHPDLAGLYRYHLEAIPPHSSLQQFSLDEFIAHIGNNYECRMQHWLQCGLYVSEYSERRTQREWATAALLGS